jgi:hypothetical protein
MMMHGLADPKLISLVVLFACFSLQSAVSNLLRPVLMCSFLRPRYTNPRSDLIAPDVIAACLICSLNLSGDRLEQRLFLNGGPGEYVDCAAGVIIGDSIEELLFACTHTPTHIHSFISIQPLGRFSRNQNPVRRPVWCWPTAS